MTPSAATLWVTFALSKTRLHCLAYYILKNKITRGGLFIETLSDWLLLHFIICLNTRDCFDIDTARYKVTNLIHCYTTPKDISISVLSPQKAKHATVFPLCAIEIKTPGTRCWGILRSFLSPLQYSQWYIQTAFRSRHHCQSMSWPCYFSYLQRHITCRNRWRNSYCWINWQNNPKGTNVAYDRWW